MATLVEVKRLAHAWSGWRSQRAFQRREGPGCRSHGMGVHGKAVHSAVAARNNSRDPYLEHGGRRRSDAIAEPMQFDCRLVPVRLTASSCRP